jgi:hypothetical protein
MAYWNAAVHTMVLKHQVKSAGNVVELFEDIFKRNVKNPAHECHDLVSLLHRNQISIPTRGNLFLPVRLLVWADGRGTVAQADSAARAELQGATNKSYCS